MTKTIKTSKWTERSFIVVGEYRLVRHNYGIQKRLLVKKNGNLVLDLHRDNTGNLVGADIEIPAEVTAKIHQMFDAYKAD